MALSICKRFISYLLRCMYTYECAGEPGFHGLDLAWRFYPIEIEHDGLQICERQIIVPKSSNVTLSALSNTETRIRRILWPVHSSCLGQQSDIYSLIGWRMLNHWQ